MRRHPAPRRVIPRTRCDASHWQKVERPVTLSHRPSPGVFLMRSSLRRPVASITAAVMLAGCVSTQAGRIGADDGRDACRAYVVQLDSTGDFYAEDILRGAAVGAGTGAIAGGLLAAMTGRRGSDILAGAAIGALAGGVIGGTAGYIQARQRQSQNQGALVQAVGGDLAEREPAACGDAGRLRPTRGLPRERREPHPRRCAFRPHGPRPGPGADVLPARPDAPRRRPGPDRSTRRSAPAAPSSTAPSRRSPRA